MPTATIPLPFKRTATAIEQHICETIGDKNIAVNLLQKLCINIHFHQQIIHQNNSSQFPTAEMIQNINLTEYYWGSYTMS